MKRLYFIRHGLSEYNVQGLFAGQIETPLTDKGRAQAKAAGHAAKNLSIDCIVSSPLSRAHETARIVAKEINYPEDKVIVHDLLIERSYGPLEGKPWSPDLDLDGFSDIETNGKLKQRTILALEWMKTLGANNILVVSHGSFGRALRHHLVPGADFSERLPNAQLVRWL